MGRPKRKDVNRDKAGKARGEAKERVMEVAIAYRAREVGYKDAADPLAGYALGRLKLRNDIDQFEFDAGEGFAKLIRRHAYIHGYQIDRLVSPGFEMVSYGVPCGDEPTDEFINGTKEEFRRVYDALVKGGVHMATTTYDICLDRCSVVSIGKYELGELRKGLSILIGLQKRR